jgi:hypothetical protein
MADAGQPRMRYTILSAGDRGMGGLMKLPDAACEKGARPGWVGYIGVPDTDAGAKRIVEAGGSLHMGPDDIPNVGRFASARAGLPQVRVHDLKHTFGRCLRAAGVSFEDRQDLLGHKSGRITTHYSAAELSNLIDAANAVCGTESRKTPALVLLRGRVCA